MVSFLFLSLTRRGALQSLDSRCSLSKPHRTVEKDVVVRLGRRQRLATTIILGVLVGGCASVSADPVAQPPFTNAGLPTAQSADSGMPISAQASKGHAQSGQGKVNAPTKMAMLGVSDTTAHSGTLGRVAKVYIIYLGICFLVLALLWR